MARTFAVIGGLGHRVGLEPMHIEPEIETSLMDSRSHLLQVGGRLGFGTHEVHRVHVEFSPHFSRHVVGKAGSDQMVRASFKYTGRNKLRLIKSEECPNTLDFHALVLVNVETGMGEVARLEGRSEGCTLLSSGWHRRKLNRSAAPDSNGAWEEVLVYMQPGAWLELTHVRVVWDGKILYANGRGAHEHCRTDSTSDWWLRYHRAQQLKDRDAAFEQLISLQKEMFGPEFTVEAGA